MIKHINEITFKGEDNWTKQFNKCSEYFKKAFDESLTEEERKFAWEDYTHERYMLESGSYNQ